MSEAVREGRSIDYKRQLPGTTDAEKREFLADVSSFANSGGGDLIFGIEESQGLPVRICGLQHTDIDLHTQRFENLLASGLAPRAKYRIRSVACSDGSPVMIVRVERSWIGPHRVVANDKFFARNSAGKYPLDVNELRVAFNLSSTVSERIRAFRIDRIIAISNNETPVRLGDEPKVVLHCIPLESLTSQPGYDILTFHRGPGRLTPMGTNSFNTRLNLEGVVAFHAGSPACAYTQLYRNGVIEAVSADFAPPWKGKRNIPRVAYERDLMSYLALCFSILNRLNASAPVAVALTLMGTRGLSIARDFREFDGGYPIERENLTLPETVVDDLNVSPGKILKPIFDLIWNECGYPASKNFDQDGNWIDTLG